MVLKARKLIKLDAGNWFGSVQQNDFLDHLRLNMDVYYLWGFKKMKEE